MNRLVKVYDREKPPNIIYRQKFYFDAQLDPLRTLLKYAKKSVDEKTDSDGNIEIRVKEGLSQRSFAFEHLIGAEEPQDIGWKMKLLVQNSNNWGMASRIRDFFFRKTGKAGALRDAIGKLRELRERNKPDDISDMVGSK